MIIRILSGIALVIALVMARAPAFAEDDVQVLSPSSDWVVDYAEDSCALRRGFGELEKEVVLEIREFGANSGAEVSVYSRELGFTRDEFSFRFVGGGGDEEFQERRGNYFTYPDGGRGVRFTAGTLSLRDAVPVPEGGAVTSEWSDETSPTIGLEIVDAFRDDFRLEIGPVFRPMEALGICLDELITHWGVDAEAHKTLQRAVVPLNMDSWVSMVVRRFPRGVTTRNGKVRIRLTVGIDGAPSDCAVQELIGSRNYSKSACKTLMRYAEFEPALDAEGDPIVSFWATSVVYRSYFGPR